MKRFLGDSLCSKLPSGLGCGRPRIQGSFYEAIAISRGGPRPYGPRGGSEPPQPGLQRLGRGLSEDHASRLPARAPRVLWPPALGTGCSQSSNVDHRQPARYPGAANTGGGLGADWLPPRSMKPREPGRPQKLSGSDTAGAMDRREHSRWTSENSALRTDLADDNPAIWLMPQCPWLKTPFKRRGLSISGSGLACERFLLSPRFPALRHSL